MHESPRSEGHPGRVSCSLKSARRGTRLIPGFSLGQVKWVIFDEAQPSSLCLPGLDTSDDRQNHTKRLT